jgi:magnesium-transporting ATPase (P-type)
MRRKPVGKNESIFAHGLGIRTVVAAVVFSIVSMLGFYIGRYISVSDAVTPSLEVGRTMAYVTLAWASVVNIINVRSFKKSIFQIGFMSNKLLSGGICLSLALVALTALIPGVREAFHCTAVSLNHWLILGGMALLPLVVIEIMKMFIRKKDLRRLSAA